MPVSAFGRNLVLFRTESGKVSLCDAYCPHLGTDLGRGGKVDHECLRCPFHHWGFGADGVCSDIPYAKKIPPQARVHSYPVMERNGAILAWFHPQDEPPRFLVPEFPTSSWSKPLWLELVLPVHIQEAAENGIDVAHFLPIHSSVRSRAIVHDGKSIPFKFRLETRYQGDGIGVPNESVDVTTEWSYYGMGLFLGLSTADEFQAQVRHLFHFTPVPGDRLHFRCAISANLETMDESIVPIVQEKNAEITIRNLQEDAPIWKHKHYLTRPVLCDGDGPYSQLRRWTSQFYLPEAAEGARTLAQGEPSSLLVLNEPEREVPPAKIAAPMDACTQPSLALPRTESVCTAPAACMAETGCQGVAESVSHIFFERMAAQFNPAAVNSNFVVQYEIGGEEGGAYVVEVRDRKYQATEGMHEAPDVRVRIQAADWLRLHSGELGSARAYLSGRLKVSGNMKLARHLATVFPIEA
jgi:nitrite reductase/ring-hydroxylating ferredoxin subunit/putative sterol carrier protein